MYIASNNETTAINDWLDYYFNRLKVGLIIGTAGSSHLKSGVGKSYTGIRLGEREDKDYNEGTTAMEKIVFSPRDFAKAMYYVEDKGTPAQIVNVDEAGILVNAKKWYQFINRGIADAVMTFRNLRSMANFICPSITVIDRDIRLFVSHLGFCNKKVVFGSGNQLEVRYYFYKLYWDETRTKYYRYRLTMYMREKERLVKFKYFKVNFPENKELLEAYEKKSKIYKKKVRTGILELDKIERGFQDFVSEILEKKEIIKVGRYGELKVYPEDVREEYDVPFSMARMISRRVNEKIVSAKQLKKGDISGRK